MFSENFNLCRPQVRTALYMWRLFEAPENNSRVEQFKDNSSQQALICSIPTQISSKYFRKKKESIKSLTLFKNFEGRYFKVNEVGSCVLLCRKKTFFWLFWLNLNKGHPRMPNYPIK